MKISALTIERFEEARIEAGTFTHEAHVYVAWLYLEAFGVRDGTERFDRALRRLCVAMGATQKYNAMVTWLFISLIAERRRDGEDWSAFAAANTDLILDRPWTTMGQAPAQRQIP